MKRLIDFILRIVGANQPPLPVIIEPKPIARRKPTVAKATTRAKKPAPRGRPKKVVETKNVKRKAKPKA